MSDQGNGTWPQQPEEGGSNEQPSHPGSPTGGGGHRLPGGTGRQQATGGGAGDPVTGSHPGSGDNPWITPQQGTGDIPEAGSQPASGDNPGTGPQQGAPSNTGGGWSGGQQSWSGGQQQQPWSGGQQPWVPGQTGPNVGPTMNNPQSSYYDRFSEASGEGVRVPQGGDGGGGRGKVFAGLAAALVVIVAAVAVFALTRGDDSPKQAAGGSRSTSALPPVKATTWTNPTLGVGARPLISGWQSQQATDDRGVFDVPDTKDWKLDSSDTLRGYGDPKKLKPLVVAKAPASFGRGYCSKRDTADIGWLGLVNIGQRDPTDAGPDIARRFADAIAINGDGSHAKTGKLSSAKKVKVDQGTIPALQYTITTAVGDPDDCNKGKHFEVRTTTFSSGSKSYQLVSVRMTDGPKKLDTATLDKIVTTFRPGS